MTYRGLCLGGVADGEWRTAERDYVITHVVDHSLGPLALGAQDEQFAIMRTTTYRWVPIHGDDLAIWWPTDNGPLDLSRDRDVILRTLMEGYRKTALADAMTKRPDWAGGHVPYDGQRYRK